MADNIKVAIKVRPLIQREVDKDLQVQWTIENNTIAQIDPETGKKKIGEAEYSFDYIFDQKSTNSDVFNATIKPVVEAAMQGFNGAIFAYGQTSSGKTHTMMGAPNEPGVILLAVTSIFDCIKKYTTREFVLTVSYLELYNEKLNDLLDTERKDLKIREENGEVKVDCKELYTTSIEDVLTMMRKGDKNRRFGVTNMNERSSRSHTIFKITIESVLKTDPDGDATIAQLNLIDLAGSERAGQTGATGERFAEGVKINSSLSTLSLVIKQLSESQSKGKLHTHINYRDSKLTRFLQTSLGGNSLTTIICAVTPAAAEETLCTLAFAQRAKGIKNKPKVNETGSDQALIKRFRKQIHKLEETLEKMSDQLKQKDAKLQDVEVLQGRIELLKAKVLLGGDTPHGQKSKVHPNRRKTWGGYGASPVPVTFDRQLPTIEENEISQDPEEKQKAIKRRKSVFLNVHKVAKDESFSMEWEDFELQLIKDEEEKMSRWSNDSDDFDTYTTRTARRVRFDLENSPQTTPEKSKSPENSLSETPKTQLRHKINDLTTELKSLRSYATLEKQLRSSDPEPMLSFVQKSLQDTEQMCRDINKKYAELQTEHSRLQIDAQESQTELSTLKKKFDTLKSENDQLKIYKSKFDEATEKLKILEDETSSHAYAMELIISQHKSREIELEKSLNDAWTEVNLHKTGDKQNGKIGELKKLCEAEKKISELTNESKELKEKILIYEKMIGEFSENEEKLIAAQKLEETFKNQAEVMKSLSEKIGEFERTVSLKNSEISDLKKSISAKVDVELENSQKADLINSLETKIDDQSREISSMSENFTKKISEKSFELNSLVESLTSQIRDLQNEKEFNSESDCNFRFQIESLEKSLESSKLSLTTLESENSKLKAEIVKLRNPEFVNSRQNSNISVKSNRPDRTLLENSSFMDLTMDMSIAETDSVFTNLTLNSTANVTNSIIIDPDQSLLQESQLAVLESKNPAQLSQLIKTLDKECRRLRKECNEKVKETEDIKNDVSVFKAGVESLQETVLLLTTENAELVTKLEAEKEVRLARTPSPDQSSTNLINFSTSGDISNDLLTKIESLTAENNELNSIKNEAENWREKGESLIKGNEELNRKLTESIEQIEAVKIDVENWREKYENLKQESEKLNQNLLEKIQILTVENNELTSMKDDVGNWRETCENLKMENEELNRNLLEKIQILTVENNELASIKNDVENWRETCENLKKENEELNQNLRKQIESSIVENSEVTSIRSDLENWREKCENLKHENEELNQNLLAKLEILTAENDRLTSIENDVENWRETCEKLTRENAELNRHVTEKTEEIEALKIPNIAENSEPTSPKNDFENWREKCATLTAQNEELNRDVIDKTEQIETIKKDVENWREQFEILKLRNSELDGDFLEKIQTLTAENSELISIKNDVENWREMSENLKKLNAELNCDLAEKTAQTEALKKEVENWREKFENLKLGNVEVDHTLLEKIQILTAENSELISLKDDVENWREKYENFRKENEELSINLMDKIEEVESIKRTVENWREKCENFEKENEDLSVNLMEKIEDYESIIKELKEANEKSDKKLQELSKIANLAELIKTYRSLKFDVKSADKKLLDLSEDFQKKTEKLEKLQTKIKEDFNIPAILNETIFNGSLVEDPDVDPVSYVENKLQKLNSDLENLKTNYDNLNLLYTNKCTEIENLKDDNKIEEISQEIQKHRHDIQKFKKYLDNISNSLERFREEKSFMENENIDLKTKTEMLNDELKISEGKIVEAEKLIKNLQEEISHLKLDQSKITKSASENFEKIEELDEAKFYLKKEILGLKNQEIEENSKVLDLIKLFICTIMGKEKEIIREIETAHKREKVRLEDQKKQLEDADKRINLWAKELEADVERLQNDLTIQETKRSELESEISRLTNLTKEMHHEKNQMEEKVRVLEIDHTTLQSELENYVKKSPEAGRSLITEEEHEKILHEELSIKNIEYSSKLHLLDEQYKLKVEELENSLEVLKSKNLDLRSTIEGLEANNINCQSIIDHKTTEIEKCANSIDRLEKEVSRLNQECNSLKELGEKDREKNEDVMKLLKAKCDKLTVIDNKLQSITPEYERLKEESLENTSRLEKYRTEIEFLREDNQKVRVILEEVRASLEGRSLELGAVRKQLVDEVNRNTVVQGRLDKLLVTNDELKAENESLMRKVRNSKSELTVERDLGDLREEMQAKISGLQSQINDLQAEKVQLEAKNRDLDEEMNDMLKKIEEVDDDNAKIESRNFALEDKLAAKGEEFECMKREFESLTQEFDCQSVKCKILTTENEKLKAVVTGYNYEMNHSKSNSSSRSVSPSPGVSSRRKRRSDIFNQNRPQELAQEFLINENCSCESYRKTIRELEHEIVLKKGKITAQDMKLQNVAGQYKKRIQDLEELLQLARRTSHDLQGEIKWLRGEQTKSTNCEKCSYWRENRRDAECQSLPEPMLGFAAPRSGVVAEEVMTQKKIDKLEGEKKKLMDYCRKFRGEIVVLTKRVKEFEEQSQSRTYVNSDSGDNYEEKKENTPSNNRTQSKILTRSYRLNQ